MRLEFLRNDAGGIEMFEKPPVHFRNEVTNEFELRFPVLYVYPNGQRQVKHFTEDEFNNIFRRIV